MARITISVVTVLGHLLPFFVAAAATAAVDRLADLVGRLWPVLIATYVVRNGRYVFLFALVCEWLVGIKTRTWVCTTSLALSQIAHPIVFADLAKPYAEAYYHVFHQPLYAACFVLFCFYFHYPTWTHGVLYGLLMQAPGWMWSHATPSGLFSLLWKAAIYPGMLKDVSIWIGRLRRWLWRRVLGPAWRCTGKAVYDQKQRFQDWRSDSPTLRFEPDSSRPLYVHHPLASKTHIRLLRVLPRGNSEVVRCSVVHVDLDDGSTPVFEAVSYTWNGSERSHVVYIDGCPFRTTKNAHDLLSDLSPISSPRDIWIDSICINQDDVAEKSWHVQSMVRIYRRAARVAVWLGTAPDADLAVGLILELNHTIQHGGFDERGLFNRFARQRGKPRWLALGKLLEHTYFTRVWMVQETSAQYDVHVMYGGHLLLWETIRRVFINLVVSHEMSTLVEDAAPIAEPNSQRMLRVGLLNGQQIIFIDMVRNEVLPKDPGVPLPPLRWLLIRCWALQATDPRDKVFALWDICAEAYDPWIAPDYTKTAAQVYSDAACYIACQGAAATFEILPCAGIGWKRAVPNLGSWVPDWSTVGRSLLSVTVPGIAAYTASGELSADEARMSLARVVDPDGATSPGLQLDAVLLLSPIAHLSTVLPRFAMDPSNPVPVHNSLLTDLTSNWLKDIHTCVTRWLAQGSEGEENRCPHTGQTTEEVIWRAVLTDAATAADAGEPIKELDHGTGRPAAARYATHYRLAMRELCNIEIATTAEERAQDEAELRRYAPIDGLDVWDKDDGSENGAKRDVILNLMSRWVTTVQLRCMSRRMACTADGRVCLVPADTEAGDCIAVVPGLGMPVVLRPQPHATLWVRREADGGVSEDVGASFYQLVGECYAHGIMDGEMADLEKCRTIVLV